MRPAAVLAFALTLAASGAAAAQGVGLRVGAAGAGSDIGGWIAPSLSAPVGYPALGLGAAPAGPAYTLGRAAYRANGIGSLDKLVDPSAPLAPYLGIGYGHLPGAGLHLYFDLGVVYQNSLAVTDAAGDRYSLGRALNQYNLSPVGQVGIRLGF